jgi:outer membrane protein W
MKKIMLGVAIVSCLFFVLIGFSSGQVYMSNGLGDSGTVDGWQPIQLPGSPIGVGGRPGVGVRISSYNPTDSNVGNDTAIEGMVGYAITNSLLTVLSVGYTTPAISDSIAEKADLTYFNLTFELRGDLNPNFAMYIGFGPSLLVKSYELEGHSDRNDTVVGGNVSIGMDYFVMHDLALNIDLKYLASFSKTKTDIAGVGVDQELPDLDGLLLGAGVKYFF